jgi:hypothetical protein
MTRTTLFASLAVLGLLLCASAVLAQQSSGSSMGMAHTDWTRRYVLTPVEFRRLKALGLTDAEVFAAANAAQATGISLDAPNFDDPVQMILRGRAMWQIAEDLNLPITTLQLRRPEWETAEFKQAAERGDWYAYPATVTTTTTTTTTTH